VTPSPSQKFLQWLRIIFFILMFSIVIGGGTWILSTIGTQSTPTILQFATQTPSVLINSTPLAEFMQLDRDLAVLALQGSSPYTAPVLSIPLNNEAPIGAYLPRDGNTQFTLLEPTAQPTPLPYPTSPPLPLPAVPGELPPVIPTVAPEIQATISTERSTVYGGDGCAPSGRPVSGVLTQRFHNWHAGIDIGVPLGTAVIATHSGIVTYADWSNVGYGYLVIVQNGDFITYYAHNTSFNVIENQRIGKGTIIAWSGSTGNSTGPHVHYEVRVNDVPVNPLTFESLGYITC